MPMRGRPRYANCEANNSLISMPAGTVCRGGCNPIITSIRDLHQISLFRNLGKKNSTAAYNSRIRLGVTSVNEYSIIRSSHSSGPFGNHPLSSQNSMKQSALRL